MSKNAGETVNTFDGHQWAQSEGSTLQLKFGQPVTIGGEPEHSLLFLPELKNALILTPTTVAEFNKVAVSMVLNFVQGWAAAALFTLLLLALVMLHGFIVRGRRAGGL